MMVIVNAELEELEIQATHRLLGTDDGRALAALLATAQSPWSVEPVAAENLPARMAELATDAAPVFGVVLPDAAYLVVGRPDALSERMARERMSSAVRGLDLAALHTALLGDGLGIGADAVAGGRLTYTRSTDEAIGRVRSGAAGAAILVRPTRLDDLAAVANASDVMPQKSTYFAPKLLTGLVFNPLTE
jgi:hypothetical protein